MEAKVEESLENGTSLAYRILRKAGQPSTVSEKVTLADGTISLSDYDILDTYREIWKGWWKGSDTLVHTPVPFWPEAPSRPLKHT